MTKKWNGHPADRNRGGFYKFVAAAADVRFYAVAAYWDTEDQCWSIGSCMTMAARYAGCEPLYTGAELAAALHTDAELAAAVAAEREACAGVCNLAGAAYLSRGADHAVDISDSFKDMAFLIRARGEP